MSTATHVETFSGFYAECMRTISPCEHPMLHLSCAGLALCEEIEELRQAVERGSDADVENEIGDVLWYLNLAVHVVSGQSLSWLTGDDDVCRFERTVHPPSPIEWHDYAAREAAVLAGHIKKGGAFRSATP
jgi:hypothetical protein